MMRHVAILAGVLVPCIVLAQTSEHPQRSSKIRICHTTYIGPADGPWEFDANWTNGIPGPNDVTCFPDQVGRGRSMPAEIAQQAGGPSHPSPLTKGGFRGVTPPPPTTIGACCLGSTCVVTDAFDCRELGGYLQEGVVLCTEATCATGVCCTDEPACIDDNGVGGDMDESLCDLIDGIYVGGAAACDETDPCQRHRIPEGYEIVEVAPGTEELERRWPRINNCAQIVFNMRTDSSSGESNRIFLYDNGLLIQMIDSEIVDAFPDINDDGTIVWVRGFDGFEAGEIVMLQRGELSVLGDGDIPRINNLDHVAWYDFIDEPPAFPSGIFFYDGNTVQTIFADELSNLSAAINDHDEIAWERVDFTGGGGFGDWTSEIMLHSGGVVAPLPSNSNTPQGPDADNQGRVAWDGSPVGLEVWDQGVTTLLVEDNTSNPALNDRGDIAYIFKTTPTPWQVWLYRDGKFSRISNDVDIENLIDNIRPAINDAGEIAWWWLPNGGLTPSGIRLMRRIRNGDVDFNGLVDLNDFIPMPGCYTGSVATDGLCKCRFFDIDHDRDVDLDDLDLFLRNYTGPVEDCNDNGVLDVEDLLTGTSVDCDLNGRPDACDLADNPGLDSDGDGLLDACCSPAAPAADTLGAKNQFLSFTLGDPPGSPLRTGGRRGVTSQAVRVTLTDLPAPFDVFNGQTMWVGEPRQVSENGSSVDPIPGFPNFTAATLTCEPFYTDWASLGTVHVYHEAIVSEGTYEIQVINEACGAGSEINFSPALSLTTAQWGDTLGDCSVIPCTPSDGVVNIIDVTGILGRFISDPDSITKARADLEPACLDLVINISDVLFALSGFQGLSYPFEPSAANPCDSTCGNPLP